MAYESGWTSVVEFQKGQQISDKYNSAFNNIDSALADIETRLDDNDTLWSTNTDSWNTQGNINTDYNDRLVALEGTQQDFTFAENNGMTVTNEAYDDAVGLTHTFSSPVGVNMYGYSITFSGTVNDKLHIEMTVPNADGTAGTPFEHIFEIKDSAEVRPKTYFFPRTMTGEVNNGQVKVRFRKGSGDADIQVNFIDVMSEIKN